VPRRTATPPSYRKGFHVHGTTVLDAAQVDFGLADENVAQQKAAMVELDHHTLAFDDANQGALRSVNVELGRDAEFWRRHIWVRLEQVHARARATERHIPGSSVLESLGVTNTCGSSAGNGNVTLR